MNLRKSKRISHGEFTRLNHTCLMEKFMSNRVLFYIEEKEDDLNVKRRVDRLLKYLDLKCSDIWYYDTFGCGNHALYFQCGDDASQAENWINNNATVTDSKQGD